MFYSYVLQLVSSDPSEQCLIPSHIFAWLIQAPVFSHLKSLSAGHDLLSKYGKYKYEYKHYKNISNYVSIVTIL